MQLVELPKGTDYQTKLRERAVDNKASGVSQNVGFGMFTWYARIPTEARRKALKV